MARGVRTGKIPDGGPGGLGGIHLLGSIPLADSADVFRTAAREVGSYVKRIPDGETGDRASWGSWQRKAFAASPAFQRVDAAESTYGAGAEWYRPLSPDTLDAADFAALGYAREALRSYEVMRELRSAQEVPATARFQVSLPTPTASIALTVEPEHRETVEPVYRRALLGDLRRILDEIPHEDLAIQWDVAVEVALLESEGAALGGWAGPKAGLFDQIMSSLVGLGDAVPSDVQLGYHLCYGNSKGKRFVEPKDTSLLVEMANALTERVARPIDFLHMPVPQDRTDPEYFAPLADLSSGDVTDLYLGLVYLVDGVEGAHRRIRAARTVRENFGIATDCGLGRTEPAVVRDLLQLHRRVHEQY
ncbi:hypothetical protein OKJ48_22465 [Streptomyces kunmingensis]|uniref:Methionine synthase n=1 Tax=Streptomyces kunmingensis TaxID=68225 RepID=A0ABU6CGH1_9ACTN|nr:hypothetical protein [Streptomyces kunmingensis]MEB3962990.1 hypothetical protein [Streptomyces kunmingensis]